MAGTEGNNHRALKWGAAVLSVVLCAGLFWYALQERNQRELITAHAEPTPYKVRPDDPGGLKVPHQDKRIFGEAVGRPDNPEENLAPAKEQPVDADALKEVPKSVPEPTPEPEPEQVRVPDKKEVPIKITQEPKIAAAPAAPVAPTENAWGVQLGAFSSEASAERAWSILRKEHKAVLGALQHRVNQPSTGAEDNLFRLWAGGFGDEEKAREACARLKQANQGCMPVPRF